MKKHLLALVFVLSMPCMAWGQAIELNAAWTLPTSELSDLADGGPGGNANLTYPLGDVFDISARVGFHEHRGKTFNLPEGVEGIPAGKITARDIPVLVGVRITDTDRRYYFGVQAGGVLKYLRLGALDESSGALDPAMAINAGTVLWKRFGVSVSYTQARYDWRHLSGGVFYRISM